MVKKEVEFEVELKRFGSWTARGEKGRDYKGISTVLEMELSVRQ